jgi:hypothetical protein
MTLLQITLVFVLVPAAAYGIGRGFGDSGLDAAVFLGLAASALVFGATGIAAGTPGAALTLAFGLPVMLLAGGAAYMGRAS